MQASSAVPSGGILRKEVDEFTRAQTVRVSPEALAYAREFADIGNLKGGNWIVSFDWVTSMIEHHPDRSDREHGPCLWLGACRRHEVPIAARDFAGGLEFAITIPPDVLAQHPLKRIELDDAKPCRLALS